ncbi:hypothetical protein ADP72_04190 [Serratia plymuthica]|nr:hypothetical protein ADP72_04190 [Serratia plymuthica]
MDYHQMSYTSEKAYFLAFRTHLRVLILVLFWSTPSLPAVADVHVEVAAKPRIVNLQGKTNWSAKRVVSVANLMWYGCGDLGSTCMSRPDSYIGWQVNSENVAYSSNAVHTSVCTPTREPADVTNATLELMRAMDSEPDYTNPVDPQSYWSISGVLETCDAKHWVYVTGGGSEPIPSPLTCAIEAIPELSIEMETGRRDADTNAKIVCNGAGRTTARVSVVGSQIVTPVKGLTVSTKVPSRSFTVAAGDIMPIDVTVTVDAKKPAPGRYQASFVYLLEFI